MISAEQARGVLRSDISVDRLMIIADTAIKNAVSSGKRDTHISLSVRLYTSVEVDALRRELNNLGYRLTPDMRSLGDDYFHIYLRW